MKKPLISIIVLTWNGKQYLKECLDSCFSQTYRNLEVIVVDNASIDGTVNYVREKYPRVRLIVNKTNLGFAEGNNVGIRNAKGEWVFILNNDTKLDRDCITELYKGIKQNQVGMISPKMDFWKSGVDTLGLQLFRKGYTADIKEFGHGNKLLAPCGGAAFYSKKMLESTKIERKDYVYDYFDSDYFIYYEDFDLGLRARIAGWKCTHVPSAKVQHLHGATMNKFSDNQVFLGDRNRSWTIIKNYPAKIFWRYFHWFIGMNLFTLIKWVVMGKPLPIIKSKFNMLLGLNKVLKKRKQIQKLKKITDKEFKELMI